MIIPGDPATQGDVMLLFIGMCFLFLIFACHMFSWPSIASFITMCVVALGQIRVAFWYGPYNVEWAPAWDWHMDYTQWCLFVPLLLCNFAATVGSVPAAGALVKRLCDPSLQPWSEDALRDDEEAPFRNETPIPSLTVLLPCYMPNEQALVEETVEHILTRLRYPRSFTLVVCYNTPRPLPIEEKLARMDGSSMPIRKA